MADTNSYVVYKRNTRQLIYWMIHASNQILKSTSTPPSQSSDGDTIKVNTTGQITVSALLPLSKLIAAHIIPIPPTILRIFESVIAARLATHSAFLQLVAHTPDPEVEKSNVSHKHFIDALSEAFKALGGDDYVQKKSPSGNESEEDEEDSIFANKFSSLGIGKESEDEDENNAGDTGIVLSMQRKQKPTSKGKKGRHGKKSKPKSKLVANTTPLADIPLESYRIIEDDGGLITDYLMAVYSLVQEFVALRDNIQRVWSQVAYEGLNSAVAGTLSNIAIAMLKQTQSAIFVEFPGHDSYETVMNTITRGNPEKAQGKFHISLHRMDDHGVISPIRDVNIDVREQFLIYAYDDLLAFIQDFQQNRSGKPTKRMQAEIRDWDPNFNLQKATNEERIKWRRSYTINFLYDLVNVFSAIVVQRNTMNGENHKLEDQDWSAQGPWDRHRRLYGMNEFAGDITSLAMQKNGTDIRQKILPHHVFQVQCITDSLAVSRGWSVSGFKGHVLRAPAKNFTPKRDTDLFLDRYNLRIGHGYCQSIETLAEFLEKDAQLHRNPNRHAKNIGILKEARDNFVDWLGETKYSSFLINIPPSRFTSSNSNGLWEYSPFLNGVGLMESLEIAYVLTFYLWDTMPEPVAVIHLYNMLVEKGYIVKPIGLWETLINLFGDSFFTDGKRPTSDFCGAFLLALNGEKVTSEDSDRRALKASILRTRHDIHGLLNMSSNRYYRTKSMLCLYREAGWNPDRILEEDILPTSALGLIRIARTKYVKDPVTGKRILENTPLVSRARALGVSEDLLNSMREQIGQNNPEQASPEMMTTVPTPEGYTRREAPKKRSGLSNCDLLEVLKVDIRKDISSESRPLSSLNYSSVTCMMLAIWTSAEKKLQARRNKYWQDAYELPRFRNQKRVSLATAILKTQDEECMRVFAREFENPRSDATQHIYWEYLDNAKTEYKGGMHDKENYYEPSCANM